MTLTEAKELLINNKWLLLGLIGIVIFSLLIVIRFSSPQKALIYEINLSGDLPKQTEKTQYNLDIAKLEIPEKIGTYAEAPADTSTFPAIAKALGLDVESRIIDTADEKISFWKKDQYTLSITSKTHKLSYQRNFRVSEITGDAPSAQGAKQAVQDYLKKINIDLKSANIDNPKLSFYGNLGEDSEQVAEGQHKFIILEYQPSVEGTPVITTTPLVSPIHASVGPGNTLYQLKIDLTLVGHPLLKVESKTKSLNSIVKSIKNGEGLILSSSAKDRLLEPNVQLLTFNATNAKIAYFKYGENFFPVVVFEGNGNTNKAKGESILIIAPAVDNFGLQPSYSKVISP